MVKIFEWFDEWKNSIMAGFAAPFDSMKLWVAEEITKALVNTFENVEPEGLDLIREASAEMAANESIPPEIRKIFAGVEDVKAPIWAVIAPLLAVLLAYPAANAAFSGQMLNVQHASFRTFSPGIFSPSEAIAAYRRGLTTEAFMMEELASNGFNAERINVLNAVTTFYPQPQDFIRFAVRDTFNASVVAKYGLDNDYPANIDSYVEKIGMSPEWMHHFWRAHWELPSPTQMYEMLHRSKITMDDARTLLKIADVAPSFIEPMLAISYNPYTRVDIRRMWDTGIIDRDEVKRSYMDGGYDETHAEKLTQWTVSQGMKEEADLTKAEIKSALAAGEITEADAVAAFQKLGYDEKESDIIVNLALYSVEKSLRNREKNVLVKKYAKNMITLSALESGLQALKMSDRELKITLEEAKLQVKEAQVI